MDEPAPAQGKRRARGRGRGRAAQPPAASSSPTPSQTSSSQPAIGRGKPKPGPSGVAPPTNQMSALSVAEKAGGSSSIGGKGNGGSDGDRPIGRYGIRGGGPLYLHTRPECAKNSKKGTSGLKTIFEANAFALTKKPQWTLNKYHVDFSPEEDRTRMRKIFLREHREKLGQYLFDGSTIFSCHNLNPKGKAVEYFSKRLSDNADIRITIKLVGTTEPGDYEYAQVFNIIMRECLKHMNLTLIKRNYFDKEGKISIREFKLELLPGYITVMSQMENGLIFQVEPIYKTLRTDTAYDLFRDIARNPGPRGFKEAFASTIIGTTVLTTYNDKTYRIDDVTYDENPESTFKQKTKDGERNISYKDYYEQRYQAKIKDPRQPMLISKTSARDRRAGMPELVYLVPELCVMTGITDQMRSNYPLMKRIAEHTSVSPSERIRRLQSWRQRLMSIPQVKEKLDNWGIGLSNELVKIDGRVLPQESIVFGGGREFPSGPDADFTKHLRSAPALIAAKLKRWVVVFPSKHTREAKELARMIINCGRGMSFNMPEAEECPIESDSVSAYVQGIEDAVNKYNPQLILFVVPNNHSARYAAIKKKTIVDKSVPSQVVLLKNIQAKSAMSIATKITVQINCKLGGAPWAIKNPMKSGMVIGFDVCHDPRDKRRSYGAMVASLDETLSRYFSAVNSHASGDELSSSFLVNVTNAVQRYRQMNDGRLPNPILMYRDGVGDGDIANVLEFEIKDIVKALEAIYKGTNIPLRFAVIIVTKRINQRFFQNRDNPKPGTVIDDVVTNPNRFDFYIVSQSVRQGTVSPTHYNVIYDTINWPVDNYQRMTYKLTHMYYNWSGTVRVPNVCQYGHKLAFLTSQSIGCQHTNLDQLLYFL